MTKDLRKFLRRYTSLSVAIDIIKNSHLVLLDPSSWDDKNDCYFIEIYKERLKRSSVQAACFTKASETYHHWRIFTQGSEGICIEFDRERLEGCLIGQDGIRFDEVEYLTVEQLKRKNVNDLPFVKRVGYGDEREWRIFSDIQDGDSRTRVVKISPDCISRIIINPWMPSSLASNVRSILKKLVVSKLKIEKSGLTNSALWKAVGDGLN